MTQINRTPFRKVADVPAHLLTSDKLKWDTPGGGIVVLTTDGKRYAYIGPDGKVGSWWDSADATFRPHGLSWEAAEALVNPPQPKPQSAKSEEPFRPGLPPAELRAVCKEWEWCDPVFGKVRPAIFQGDTHILTDRNDGPFVQESYDNFRPLGKTWAEVEALAAAKQYRTVGEVLKAGLFDVCSHWYVKGHSEERRLGVVQERKLYASVSMRVVKDLLSISSKHFSADDLIRPSRVTWGALEAELAHCRRALGVPAKKSIAAPARKLTPNETSTRKHPVPVGGWVMRTDEGYPGVPTGTRAQVEGINDSGSYKVRLSDGRQHNWSPEFCAPCASPVETPKNGDLVTVEGAIAVVKEGCRQALQEERQQAKVGSYFDLNRTNNVGEELRQAVEPTQEPTYIVACPKGRRKYVKYYLSQHTYTGNKNLDALPYSTADKPFWLGYVSAKLREELTALAPDIRFSVG